MVTPCKFTQTVHITFTSTTQTSCKLFTRCLQEFLTSKSGPPRVTEVLSGPDVDAMPQPSFWGPLLIFSHRQIIDQIQSLQQVTTEVGYCRAWIRLALNEGMLSSYLASIRRDNSALNPYYSRAAFIRDVDLVKVAQRHVESFDHVRFELACNSRYPIGTSQKCPSYFIVCAKIPV